MNQIPSVGRSSPLSFVQNNPVISLVIIVALASIAFLARSIIQLQRNIHQLRAMQNPNQSLARLKAQAEADRDGAIAAKNDAIEGRQAAERSRDRAIGARDQIQTELARVRAEGEAEQGRLTAQNGIQGQELIRLRERVEALDGPIHALAAGMTSSVAEARQHILDLRFHFDILLARIQALPAGGEREDLEATYAQMSHFMGSAERGMEISPQLRDFGRNMERKEQVLEERERAIADREGLIDVREASAVEQVREADTRAQQRVAAAEADAQKKIAAADSALQEAERRNTEVEAKGKAVAHQQKLLDDQRREFAEARKKAAAEKPAESPSQRPPQKEKELEEKLTIAEGRIKAQAQELRTAYLETDAEKEKVRKLEAFLEEEKTKVAEQSALSTRLRARGLELRAENEKLKETASVRDFGE